MIFTLNILGLILGVIGGLIMAFAEAVTSHYGKMPNQPLKKRYWWNGWRPFYKNTQTSKWMIKWNHRPVIEGMIPPKYKLLFFGAILILIGLALQI